MGSIEHRRDRRRVVRATGLARVPLVGRVFLVLAVVVGVIELWPLVEAWWNGATEWWSALPQLLPSAAQAAARVGLPAAVAWGSGGWAHRNRWLWRGAVIIALVVLVRYPVGLVRDALLDGIVAASDGEVGDLQLLALNLGFSVPLALASILGVWTLAEGVKDAGGDGAGAVVVAAVVAASLALLLLVPSFMAGVVLGANLATGLLSVGLNVLFVFAHGLLAGRVIAGALRGGLPAGAWRWGAAGAVALFVVPVLSVVLTMVNLFVVTDGSTSVVLPLFSVLALVGWPLVAFGLAQGMARRTTRMSAPPRSSYVVRGPIRVTDASAA